MRNIISDHANLNKDITICYQLFLFRPVDSVSYRTLRVQIQFIHQSDFAITKAAYSQS